MLAEMYLFTQLFAEIFHLVHSLFPQFKQNSIKSRTSWQHALQLESLPWHLGSGPW